MSETEIPQGVLEIAREYATRGAELLDEERPGWAEEIDRKRLDMGSPYTCILGQLYGSYGAGLYALRSRFSFNLGFSVISRCELRSPVLNQVWDELIEERLAVPV